MTKSIHILSRRVLLTVAAFALFATACGGGGGGGGGASGAASSTESAAASAAAATNESQLTLTGDVSSTQLLDTADGSIHELSDVVTGDRPVLLWYWAPH